MEELPIDMIERVVQLLTSVKGGSAMRGASRSFRDRFDELATRITYRPTNDGRVGLDSLSEIIYRSRCVRTLEIDTQIAPDFNLNALFSLHTSVGKVLGKELQTFKISRNYQLLRQVKDIGSHCPNLLDLELDGECVSSYSQIGSRSIDSILRGCLFLQRLKVSGGRFNRLLEPSYDQTSPTLHSADTLQPLQNLTYLSLSSHNLEDINPLSSCVGLRHLSLSGCSELKSLTPISKCVDLRHLDLSSCHLLDVDPLAFLTRISHLNLAWARVASLDLSPLSPLRNLEDLNLSGMVPQPTAPMSCISESKGLVRLNLSYLSSLTSILTILPSILPSGSLRLLQELDLSKSSFTDLSSLIGFDLPELRKFKMSGGHRVEAIKGLCRWPNLRVVDLSDSKILGEISAFECCNQIESIDLSGTNIQNVSPLLSSARQSLTALNLSCCYSASIELTGSMDKLASVSLKRCYYSSSIEFLARSSYTLQLLDISETSVKDLSPLAGSLSLKTLYASRCHLIKDIGPLASLDSLETLDLSECHKLSNIEPLGSLRSLRNLHLRGCINIKDVSPLVGCLHLTFLDIGFLSLSFFDAALIKGWVSQKHLMKVNTYPDRIQPQTKAERIKKFVLGSVEALFQFWR